MGKLCEAFAERYGIMARVGRTYRVSKDSGDMVEWDTQFSGGGRSRVIRESIDGAVYLDGEPVAADGVKSAYCVAEERIAREWHQ